MSDNTFSGHPHLVEYKAYINGVQYLFNSKEITVEDLLNKVHKEPYTCYSVWQAQDGCGSKLIRPNQKIDLGDLGAEEFETRDPVVFNYFVGDEPETTEYSTLTPLQVLERAAIDSKTHYLVQLFRDRPEIIYAWTPNAEIKMLCTGTKFECRRWVDTAEIEELGKHCQQVPVARHYKLKIQNKGHVVDLPFLTRPQIVQLGGKHDLNHWDVLAFYSNQATPEKLGNDEVVDLTKRPCLLYFVLQPKQQTEGRSIRREFGLPAEDQAFLNAQSLPWETLRTPYGACLFIRDLPVPDGYTIEKVDLGLIIPTSYPAAEIDMAYFSPALHLKSGRHIGGLTNAEIDSRTFQRWSRHRAPGQWVPGVDNVATHLYLVNNWLTKETGA